MSKIVYVIHEKDLQDNQPNVIGVASTPAKAMELIDKYYGEYIGTVHDIRDSGIECMINVLPKGTNNSYSVTVLSFNIDQL